MNLLILFESSFKSSEILEVDFNYESTRFILFQIWIASSMSFDLWQASILILINLIKGLGLGFFGCYDVQMPIDDIIILINKNKWFYLINFYNMKSPL